jgi:protein-L-isoaspartate(D-aspartate) O-methyltransferase
MITKIINRYLYKTVLLFIFLFFLNINETNAQENDGFNSIRYKMVETQIHARGISNNTVLRAFRKVPRHRFVLPEYISYAYNDTPLPITEGQTISQPYIVAFMTDALDLKPTDKVLEIGTGSGYQAAILSEICDSVYTIEIFESLVLKAKQLFSDLDYSNIYCKTGDGYKGWSEHAPFDAIIVTCSPTHVPQSLKYQLAEGGKMIIPVGEGRIQYLVLLQKKRGKINEKNVLPVRFVPMIDKEKKIY